MAHGNHSWPCRASRNTLAPIRHSASWYWALKWSGPRRPFTLEIGWCWGYMQGRGRWIAYGLEGCLRRTDRRRQGRLGLGQRPWRAANEGRPEVSRLCPHCGRAFEPSRGTQRCCGRKCYDAAYRAANRARIAKYQAAYRAANRDAIAKYHAAYRAAHRDRIAKREAAYYAANRERLAKRYGVYYAANRKRILTRNAAYRAANREKHAVYYAANRERILKRQAAYDAANRDRILKRRAAHYAANRARILKQEATYRATMRAGQATIKRHSQVRASRRRQGR